MPALQIQRAIWNLVIFEIFFQRISSLIPTFKITLCLVSQSKLGIVFPYTWVTSHKNYWWLFCIACSKHTVVSLKIQEEEQNLKHNFLLLKVLHILWVDCFKQKCILKSVPVMLFGFCFVSKILETVRVSQISSGLQGCQVICHSCPEQLVNIQSCRLLPWEVEDIVRNFFLLTPVCSQGMYIIPVSANSNNRRQFSYMLLTGSFLSSASLSKESCFVFFYTSAGV